MARPDNSPPSIPSVETTTNDESVAQIPEMGVVYGLIFNFTSPDDIHFIDPVDEESESVTSKDDDSNANGGKLVRKKRFLFGVIGSALQSLRSDNWRECGRTSWGTTIYTNGIATACYGACPEHVYCGYGYERSDGYGYGNQINTVNFG